jgi:hypothetical protein
MRMLTESAPRVERAGVFVPIQHPEPEPARPLVAREAQRTYVSESSANNNSGMSASGAEPEATRCNWAPDFAAGWALPLIFAVSPHEMHMT